MSHRAGNLRHISSPLALLALGCLVMGEASADRYQLGGGFEGTAKVEAAAVQVDNYFYQDDDEISATGYRVRPEVSVNRPGLSTQFGLTGFLENSDYDIPGKLDNYFDFGASSDLGWRPFRRHNFDLTGAYRRGHDPAGLRRTEDGPDFSAGEIDRWDQNRVDLSYRYGSPDSLGSNTLRAGRVQRRYSTNRDNTLFLDYSVRSLEYELAYEASPKTALLFNVEQRATDYRRAVLARLGNRNGNELVLTGGVRWVATGKTSGEFRVGVRNYSLDGRQRPSRQSLAYRLSVLWNPSLVTAFKLTGQQSTAETFRADTFFIEERRLDFSWQQTWSSRFSTSAGAGYENSKFVGSTREDDFVSASLGFDFLVARQFTVFGQYLSRNRNSSFRTLDYDAPESKLGLRWTL